VTDPHVTVNIKEVTDRISAFLWDGNSFPKLALEAVGCDILWIFQKIGIFFVDTQRSKSSSLWVSVDELFLSTEPPQTSLPERQNPSLPHRESTARPKKRIIPTSVSALTVTPEPINPLVPYLCHPCDDYAIGGDAEFPLSLLKCDHLGLTRFANLSNLDDPWIGSPCPLHPLLSSFLGI
jgi:hypothetical protein